MEYRQYLSPEVLAFIDETLAFYPDDLDPTDWAAQRRVYNAMAAHFHAGRPVGLQVSDQWIADVPVRLYGPPSKTTVLYAHGGGFVLGGLESHDDVCAEIADLTGCRVVSVDYRLSPEHPHPAAYEDTVAVAEILCAEGPVVLCGDSAGGTLCAAIAGTRADLGFVGQVLIYPMIGYPARGGSFDVHSHAPLLSTSDLAFYADVRGGSPDDPRLIPALGDLSALPPTWLFPAECDPLCDDAVRFADAIKGEVHLCQQDGLVHGWLRARDRSDMTRQAFGQIINAIVDLAG
ncbi:alpha/beta hydrolase [Marivivens sp.]|uniref:alpha/beta hydrolase n=1 Tax=Marivivens sp. TaxID=1978374 RepID=UPI0025C2FB84|nr:alpha/beta hydrolase [Marivivens sp.]